MASSSPDKQGSTTEASDMAILFADIGGSTSLYQREGDTQGHQLIVNSLGAMRTAVESAGGTLLRTVGDAVLASFDTCDQASVAAIAIQELHTDNELSVRVGFHWGRAIADDGDVYGNAVNIAARVSGLANTGEITVTADVVQRLSNGIVPTPQLLDEIAVKGIDEPLSVYRIPWRVQGNVGDATVVANSLNVRSTRTVKTHILLRFGEHSLVLDEHSEKCTIGRDTNSVVTTTHSAASRLHATIECKQGVYVLEDLSTNGTYVIKPEQPPVYVHRDKLTLDGSGYIATGFLPEKDSTDKISFVTRLADTA